MEAVGFDPLVRSAGSFRFLACGTAERDATVDLEQDVAVEPPYSEVTLDMTQRINLVLQP
jgi:hypothetical protein